MPQTTIVSFFKYHGFKPKWEAFSRMGRPPLAKSIDNQPLFWKALGSGGGNGFSMWPDFSTYGLLTVFSSEEEAYDFLESDAMLEYKEKASAFSHVLMHNIKAQGTWSGSNPFDKSATYDESKPLAVITRATIKPKLAYKFWKYVPSVSKSMDNYAGLIYSKGIGEWPILMQATFSLWQTGDNMMAYAYKNKKHADMVAKTRALGWYSEELFSRFQPFDIKGTLITGLSF